MESSSTIRATEKRVFTKAGLRLEISREEAMKTLYPHPFNTCVYTRNHTRIGKRYRHRWAGLNYLRPIGGREWGKKKKDRTEITNSQGNGIRRKSCKVRISIREHLGEKNSFLTTQQSEIYILDTIMAKRCTGRRGNPQTRGQVPSMPCHFSRIAACLIITYMLPTHPDSDCNLGQVQDRGQGGVHQGPQ